MTTKEFNNRVTILRRNYLRTLLGKVEKVAQAVQLGDWQSVGDQAHKLSGTSGCFGFKEISETSSKVENAVKSQNYKEASVLVAKMLEIARRHHAE